jgi:hypothetical protein
MATIIRLPQQKVSKSALQKEIKKYDTPGRNPEKAIVGMYGLWEGQDISIEKIRAVKRRKNIAKTTECTAKLCRHSNVKIKLSPSSIQVHWLTTSKCLKSK